jgi:hypothetical protein
VYNVWGLMKIPKYRIKYQNRDFLADDAGSMIENITKYLTNRDKHIDIDEIRSHVNKNIKDSGPSDPQDIGGKLNKVAKKTLRYKEVMNGAQAILRVLGGDSVDQDEIKRRTRICRECPLKSLTSDCYGCGFASRLTGIINDIKSKFTGTFELSQDVKGSYCSVCSCALSVMIPSKMSAFDEDEEKQKSRPDYCWVKKGGTEYVQN